MKLILRLLEPGACGGFLYILAVISTTWIWLAGDPEGAWYYWARATVLALALTAAVEWLRGWWRDHPETLGWRWIFRGTALTVSLTILQAGVLTLGACPGDKLLGPFRQAICEQSKGMQPRVSTAKKMAISDAPGKDGVATGVAPREETPKEREVDQSKPSAIPESSLANAQAGRATNASSASDVGKSGDEKGLTDTLATVLSVVLAVVTLVATKTATDARAEVREAKEAFEHARKSQELYLDTECLAQRVFLLSEKMRAEREAAAASTEQDSRTWMERGKMIDKLLAVLAGISTFGNPDFDSSKLVNKTNLLNQSLDEWSNRNHNLFDTEFRHALRGIAVRWLERLQMIHKNRGVFQDDEQRVWQEARRALIQISRF